jgi:hypothetical protein
MKYELTTLAIWLVALLATIGIVKDSGLLTYLLPVFAICMIGSVMVVRKARGR